MKFSTTAGVSALVLVLSTSVLIGCGRAKTGATAPAPCAPAPMPVAHRGGIEKAMENTLNAFRAAGKAGITRWELDVQFDVRGTPVVLHDETVDRVSPRSGPVKTLDAGNRGIPTDDGQYVPTLREVYDEAKTYGAHVLTEFKVMPTDAQWTAVAASVDATIGRSQVTLMSFDGAIVKEARKRIPGTATALVHVAPDLSADQVKVYGDSFVEFGKSISADLARQWHAEGIHVYAWTVDQPADWARLRSLPVDAVITNKPMAYRTWLAGHCQAGTRTP